MITETDIIIPEAKRKYVAQVEFKDVQSYVVDEKGQLSVVHEDGIDINLKALKTSVDNFTPKKSDSDVVSDKPDNQVTLADVVKVLREKGILQK